ncbi:uracil-DNA glycosylase [Sporolactobacillus sp. THM7-7]|nr:uracil-DNA glycosylase [Sporolactobacillus sp. THM7-7]
MNALDISRAADRSGGLVVKHLPETLVCQAQKRMRGFAVEGFVPGQGPDHPKIMLVGEAPGETEIKTGVPFSGRAGRELMGFLQKIGLTREKVFITSAVRSRPYRWREKKRRDGTVIKRKDNRPPTQKEMLAHAALLDYEIKQIDPDVIVPLGNIGLNRLIGPGMKITNVHGRLSLSPIRYLVDFSTATFGWTEKAYAIFPMFHPASIFYNRRLLERIDEDLQKLHTFITEGGA